MVTKVALVTGASLGIGKAISKELVKRGWQVVGVVRSMEKLDQLQKELSEAFIHVACDVFQKEQIIKSSSSILKKGLILSLFFLNAGRAGEAVIENPNQTAISVSRNCAAIPLVHRLSPYLPIENGR